MYVQKKNALECSERKKGFDEKNQLYLKKNIVKTTLFSRNFISYKKKKNS